MVEFDVQLDDRGAREISARLRLMDRLAARAVNDTALEAESKAVNRITEHLNLRRDYVEDKFSIKRASTAVPTAFVNAVDRPVQIRQYAARQEYLGSKRAGVSVEVLRGGPRKTLRSAFFGSLKSGAGTAVYGRKGAERHPLRVLYAPSPGQMFKTIGPELSEVAMKRLLNDAFERTGRMFSVDVGVAL